LMCSRLSLYALGALAFRRHAPNYPHVSLQFDPSVPECFYTTLTSAAPCAIVRISREHPRTYAMTCQRVPIGSLLVSLHEPMTRGLSFSSLTLRGSGVWPNSSRWQPRSLPAPTPCRGPRRVDALEKSNFLSSGEAEQVRRPRPPKQLGRCAAVGLPSTRIRGGEKYTANLRTKILDFRGFDSSRV
jgi:hypothetical protein